MATRGTATVSIGATELSELERRGLEVPRYDRSRLRPRIAHIGVGGFHRAHLAVYCDELAEQGGDWGIRGLGLLTSDRLMADVLAEQDHLYTLTVKDGDERRSRVIGSIIDYRLADDDPAVAIDTIADPGIGILSMTVTEAGYSDHPGNRRTFEIIVEALERRRREGTGPLTVLSCDNLPGNGDVARQSVLNAATRVGADCSSWIAEHCTFPNSMVDRITPVTADVDRLHLDERYGLRDRWPVVAEPFMQWALEDDFAAGRPQFDDAGALFTDDVHAWELYKLRLLNAGHSAIAYLSALAGITYVDEAMADPQISTFLETLLTTEAVPTLTPIADHPREDYVASVLTRFGNVGVRDQIARLCVDGTAKFPKFLIPTVAAQLANGQTVRFSAHALAGWAHYLADLPEHEQAHDEHGATSREFATAAREDPRRFLDHGDVFPDDVARHGAFIVAFDEAHRSITEHGPRGALDLILNEAR